MSLANLRSLAIYSLSSLIDEKVMAPRILPLLTSGTPIYDLRPIFFTMATVLGSVCIFLKMSSSTLLRSSAFLVLRILGTPMLVLGSAAYALYKSFVREILLGST